MKDIKIGVFVLLSISMIAIGCSSGGGGGVNPTTTPPTTTPPTGQTSTITGSVSAPSGQLAKLQPKSLLDHFVSLFVSESIAQVAGAQPVQNMNILLFQIDNQGNPVGNVLASTTTDTSGNYSLTLPEGTSLSSNLIVQASSSTTPSGVNDPNTTTLNCPAVNSVLNIDPAAQVAILAVIQEIAANGGTLSNFTNSELNGFLAQVQTVAQVATAGLSIQAAIINIQIALQSTINTAIAAISPPGGVAVPANFGGKYNMIEYFSTMNEESLGSIGRDMGIGTLTLNTTDQTWTISSTLQRVSRSVTCTVGVTCQRNFTRKFATANSSDSGTYQLGGNGKLILTSSNSTDVSLLDVNSDGTILVSPSVGATETGMSIMVKEGVGLSSASVDGSTFASSGLYSFIPPSSTSNGTWNSYSATLFTGSLAFSGSNLTTTDQGSDLSQTITCTNTGTGCGLSVSLNVVPAPDSGSGPFSVLSTGKIGPDTFLSPDANFIVGGFGIDPSDPEKGLGLNVRRGVALSNASLNGIYNIAEFDEGFEILPNGSADNWVGMIRGTITFDGSGGFTSLAFGLGGPERNECVTTGTCPFVGATGEPGWIITASGTYTVSPNGDFSLLTVVGESPASTGTVSENGETIIISDVGSRAVEIGGTFGIGLKQ